MPHIPDAIVVTTDTFLNTQQFKLPFFANKMPSGRQRLGMCPNTAHLAQRGMTNFTDSGFV